MDLTKDTVQLLFSHGAQTGQPKDLKNGDQYILVPDGYAIETVEAGKYELPPYIKAQPNFTSVESFIDYVREFRTEALKVFGQTGRYVAILDYHVKGKPDHLKHLAFLTLAKTPEWDRWMGMNGKVQEQSPFAEFLEENRLSVIEPEAAQLIEIVTNLSSKTDVEFSSQTRSSDGTIVLSYSEKQETTGGKGKLPLPQKIRLALPVFKGYRDREGKPAPFPLEFFLRSRIANSKAVFILKADGWERVVQAALDEVNQRIEADLGLKILEGNPAD